MMPVLGSQLNHSHAISAKTFRNVFLRLLPYSHGSKLPRIAIAISGGVDSMALVKLCSDFEAYGDRGNRESFSFKALIVDHKARKGSDVEANQVQRRLASIGIASRVLSLAWPPGVQPLNLPDFETQARRLRFRALGKACKDHGIGTLLLAQHSDDQAETTLMRLADGHKGKGLQGMQEIADIPECWGLHGVCESGCHGQAEETIEPSPKFDFESTNDPMYQQARVAAMPSLFEAGGVKVLRPLLGFTKRALVETCQAGDVEWVEDQTNQDAWRTPRNTIRSLLSRSCLPRALSRPSLLQITSRAKEAEAQHVNYAMRLASQSGILDLDLRSGSLTVRFASPYSTDIQSPDGERKYDELRLAALLIQTFVKFVTPLEHGPLQALQSVAKHIFPDLNIVQNVARTGTLEQQVFTVAGVHFQRVNLPLVSSDSARQNLDHENVWRLTRQPYVVKSLKPNILTSGHAPVHLRIPGKLCTAENGPPSCSWSPWQLWDGRFWIRVLSHTLNPLEVRPFCASDMQAIRAKVAKDKVKRLEQVLASAAPGKVRWTLPVIAEVGEDGIDSGCVLMLPTLGGAGVLGVSNEDGSAMVEWEIRYKQVDFSPWLEKGVWGSGKSPIISWEDS